MVHWCLIAIHSQIPSRTTWTHFRYSHRYPSLALRNEKVSALSRFQRTMMRVGKGHFVIIIQCYCVLGRWKGTGRNPSWNDEGNFEWQEKSDIITWAFSKFGSQQEDSYFLGLNQSSSDQYWNCILQAFKSNPRFFAPSGQKWISPARKGLQRPLANRSHWNEIFEHFCGTSVALQRGALSHIPWVNVGQHAFGSSQIDSNPKMVILHVIWYRTCGSLCVSFWPTAISSPSNQLETWLACTDCEAKGLKA